MNSKAKGNITEAVIMSEFIKLGIPVLLPFGDNERYDMVIEVNNKFYKIQCKTARRKSDSSISFKTCSSYAHRGKDSKNYVGEVDFFGVYYPESNQCYLVEVGNCLSEMTLRLNPAKNNQSSNVNYAKDYLLEEKLKSI